eukprot:SAG31_NODE_5275_length_2637_cov_2.078802_3_plen_109_part_00
MYADCYAQSAQNAGPLHRTAAAYGQTGLRATMMAAQLGRCVTRSTRHRFQTNVPREASPGTLETVELVCLGLHICEEEKINKLYPNTEIVIRRDVAMSSHPYRGTACQ